METNDNQCADREVGDNGSRAFVEQFAAVEHTEEETDIDRVEEGDVQEEDVFVEMPIKEQQTDGETAYEAQDALAGVDAAKEMVLPHDIAQVVIRQSAEDADGGQVGQKLPVFVGGIEEKRGYAERDHDKMLVSRLATEVYRDMHDEYGRQIPQWAVEGFAERVLMFAEQGTEQGAYGVEKVGQGIVVHVVFHYPVGIDEGIVDEVG